jgi:DNA-directed RNA polymerase specialized sigma24 family protein
VSSEGSVTRLIGMLKNGDEDAAQQLWQAYSQRVIELARARLRPTSRALADEEDVALSVFETLFRRAERDQFPRLSDRDDLWQLLFVLTVRKSISLKRRQGRQSRGSGRVQSLSDLDSGDLEMVIGAEPTPELAAQVAEECGRLLERLSDPTLRSVALWKMDGCTNLEIASRLGCVEQTVERKVRSIRRIWGGANAS